MSHKASVEALDRTMRDFRNSNCPMGEGIYSNISTKTLNCFQERAILSPTNEQID